MIQPFMPSSVSWLLRHPVFRQRPWQTLGRWIYWQARQRLTQRPMRSAFVNDSYLMIYPQEGLTGYWYVTLPDYHEQTFLLRFLREGDLFFDVGANAGAYSVLAASAGCRVLAFEPVPRTFERLVSNINVNNALSIRALPMAVGESNAKVRMTTDLGPGNHLLVDATSSAGTLEVDLVPLNNIAESEGYPTFIKIDVEGFELEVIQGAEKLLKNQALMGLLIETFRADNWQSPKLRALEDYLKKHGFLPYEFDVDCNQVRELKSLKSGGNNTFYLRDLDRIEQRLLMTEGRSENTKTCD